MYKNIIYKGELTNYKIDKNGNVLSLFSNKVLQSKSKKNGYREYCLYINKRKVNLLAHRIVAVAFIDNPNNLETVSHIR